MGERRFQVPAILLVGVLLTGCGREDERGASVATAAPSTSPPATASTSAPSQTSAAAPPAGATTTGGGATEDASPVAQDAPGTGPQPGSPPEVVPTHGERVWAVYLAVGSPDVQWDMHKLGETESYLRGRYGYTGSGIGSVGCDQGAAEALGFDPAHNRVAVYFGSAGRAQEFVAVYDRQDVGSAEVTTYCLD